MNLTEEQLEELQNLAALFFSVEDILIALELPLHLEAVFSDIILLEKTNPIYEAYHRGRLQSEIELRNTIKRAALNGSNPAITEMLNFRRNQ